MSTKKQFGHLLRNLRKDNKFTITKLSELSGVSERYISDLENAKYIPSLEIIFKLADALGYPADQMVKWIDLNRFKD